MRQAESIKTFRIEAFAVWRATAEVPRPEVSFVPPLARRRLTEVERAAISVAWRVKPDGEVPVVFASRWGEIGTTFKLMRQMHDEGEMSPAGFSSSVHNAAPGAWSLFTKNRAPYTAIAARDRSYEMGLVEAEAQLAAGAPYVLYIYAEESTPEYYLPAFGETVTAQAVAMLLKRETAS